MQIVVTCDQCNYFCKLELLQEAISLIIYNMKHRCKKNKFQEKWPSVEAE